MIHIYTDGACQKKQGGYAVVLYQTKWDHEKQMDIPTTVLLEIGGFLGECTSNEAEYYAIEVALDLAQRIGLENVLIHSDSELIVKQLNGQYQIKADNLKTLALRIHLKAKQFKHVYLKWVSREENTDADRVAKTAVETQQQWKSCPNAKILDREVRCANIA